MNSILVRVDNRLVHGQILEAWVPHYSAARIVVLNDEVADDPFRASVIRMVVPSDIEVQVSPVESFSRAFNADEWSDCRTIVLLKDIDDARRAFQAGFVFDRLNIGNVHNENGKCCITSSIYLSAGERDALQELADAGVAIELRCIPKDKPLDFRRLGGRMHF